MSTGPSRLSLAVLGACLAGCSAAPPALAKQESQFKPFAASASAPTSQEPEDPNVIAIDAPRAPSCPPGTRRRGGKCEQIEIVCPPGSTLIGTSCVGQVLCPDNTSWNGQSCVAGAASPPAGASPPGSTCTLRFNSIPVSTVFLDGAEIGLTPRINVSAAVGTHVVLFVNEDVGKKTVTVSCKAGETRSVAVKL